MLLSHGLSCSDYSTSKDYTGSGQASGSGGSISSRRRGKRVGQEMERAAQERLLGQR